MIEHPCPSLKTGEESRYTVPPSMGQLSLLLGIDLVKDKRTKKPNISLASEIVKKSLNNGLIIRSCGRYSNVLLLSPPLTLSYGQAKIAYETLSSLMD